MPSSLPLKSKLDTFELAWCALKNFLDHFTCPRRHVEASIWGWGQSIEHLGQKSESNVLGSCCTGLIFLNLYALGGKERTMLFPWNEALLAHVVLLTDIVLLAGSVLLADSNISLPPSNHCLAFTARQKTDLALFVNKFSLGFISSLGKNGLTLPTVSVFTT